MASLRRRMAAIQLGNIGTCIRYSKAKRGYPLVGERGGASAISALYRTVRLKLKGSQPSEDSCVGIFDRLAARVSYAKYSTRGRLGGDRESRR